MNKKSTLLVVVLLCCFSLLYAQDHAEKPLTLRINSDVVKVENSISDSLNNNLARPYTEKEIVSNIFFDNFSIGLNYGVTQFRGDIKGESFFIKSSIGKMYSFFLLKKINDLVSVNLQVGKGDLSGEREHHSYSISSTTSNLYNPYYNYENKGEKFECSIIESNIIFKFDLQEIAQYFLPAYKSHHKFNFLYDLGFGMIAFESMKRNLESDTYIYAYGYDDLEGDFETFDKLIKGNVLLYGVSAEYKILNNFDLVLSSVKRLAFTDFLDSSEMKSVPSNDSYRVVSFGLKYNL